MSIRVRCAWCGAFVKQSQSAIGRALREFRPLYCDRSCAGAARRISVESKKAMKAAYDYAYRAANRARIKERKAARHRRVYDPAKAAVERQARMPQHVEYCRQPAYREKKQQYDLMRRHEMLYGEFADAALVLRNIDMEVNKRATRYEIYATNGTLNKAQLRRRSMYDESRKERR